MRVLKMEETKNVTGGLLGWLFGGWGWGRSYTVVNNYGWGYGYGRSYYGGWGRGGWCW